MKTKYDHLSKGELVAQLIKRDSERKLGLVWERDTIEHDRAMNCDFVALNFVPELSVGEAPYQNIVIEGDNFDALRYLSIAFRGRIKCIYIDPPYNTGNKDFIYNDRFVDKEDIYKHSKWLEFIYRRLTLARDLLSEDGVILVSINDENRAKLELLLDQIFPGMRVGSFVWKCRSGCNDAKGAFLSVDHEHILCFANPVFSFSGEKKDSSSYSNPDNDPRGPWANDNLNVNKTYRERPNTYYPIENPDTKVLYPCNPDRVWGFASKSRLKPGQKIRTKTMEQLISEEKILWPKDDRTVFYSSLEELLAAIDAGTAPRNLRRELPDLEFWVGKHIGMGMPRYKKHFSELKRSEKPLSTWIVPKSADNEEIKAYDINDTEVVTAGYTSDGTAQLRRMIGQNEFPYPKPLALIKGLLQQATSSNDIILDFFAGSGTTAQAVLELNKEEDGGGNRRFILVSSAESTESEPDKNICHDVCAKRIKAVIEGYGSTQGTGGNFAYMQAQRIPFDNLLLDIHHDQVWYTLQLLHGDGVCPYDDRASYQLTTAGNPIVIYVPSLTSEARDAVIALANQAVKSMVIYTWQPGILAQSIFNEHVCIEQVPEYLTERFSGGAA